MTSCLRYCQIFQLEKALYKKTDHNPLELGDTGLSWFDKLHLKYRYYSYYSDSRSFQNVLYPVKHDIA